MTHKFIYWPQGAQNGETVRASVHLIVGYTAETLAAFEDMAKSVRDTFPDAKNCKLKIGRIANASGMDGFSIIHWTAELTHQPYHGWTARYLADNEPFPYPILP